MTGKYPNINTVLNRAAESFFDLLYPQCCYSCGMKLANHGHFYLCENCEGKVLLIENPLCSVCGYPGSHNPCPRCVLGGYRFDIARAHAVYDGVLSDGIKMLKYGRKSCLVKTFGRMLAACVEKYDEMRNIDLLAPVPLAGSRERERGFNQANLLARELGRILRIKVSGGNLIRLKNTMPQTSLDRKMRMVNVKGIFRVKRREEFSGKDVMLIDDVFTTGATVNECAKTLKEAGAMRVKVLTVARSR